MKKSKELFLKDPTNYDPNLSLEEIIDKFDSGEYDKDDVLANFFVHAIVADEYIKVSAKKTE